jgi:PST family polysaccharide transporter
VSKPQVAPLMARDTGQIGNRVSKSALLLLSSTILLRVLQLVTAAVLARLLTPADYGIVALAMVVTGLIDKFTNVQVGGGIAKVAEMTHAHLDTAFTLNLIRAALSALVMVLLAGPAANFMHEPRLRDVLYVLAIPTFASGLHNPHFLLFSRDLNFSQDVKRSVIAAVLASIVGIVGALVYHSYWALVASAVVSGLSWTIFTYWRIPIRVRLSLKKTRALMSYGTWVVLIGVMDELNYRTDYLLIGRYIGSAGLGAYNVGQVLTTTATGDVVDSMGKALFPAFAIMSNDRERLRNGYKRIQTIMLALALPVGFGMSAVAADVVLVLFGHKWLMAIPVVALLAPIVALQSVTASVESLLLSLNKGAMLFGRTTVFLLLRVVLMGGGFYLDGFMGIVYGRVIYGFATLFYTLALAGRMTQSRMLDPVIASWRSLAAVAVMYGGILLLFPMASVKMAMGLLIGFLVMKIAAGAVLYIGTHAGLWLAAGRPDGAERSLLSQGKRLVTKIQMLKTI